MVVLLRASTFSNLLKPKGSQNPKGGVTPSSYNWIQKTSMMKVASFLVGDVLNQASNITPGFFGRVLIGINRE